MIKFDIRAATLGVLVFTGIDRMIEVLNNFVIKPNIPNEWDPQERDAVRLFIEIIMITIFIFIIKKFT